MEMVFSVEQDNYLYYHQKLQHLLLQQPIFIMFFQIFLKSDTSVDIQHYLIQKIALPNYQPDLSLIALFFTQLIVRYSLSMDALQYIKISDTLSQYSYNTEQEDPRGYSINTKSSNLLLQKLLHYIFCTRILAITIFFCS